MKMAVGAPSLLAALLCVAAVAGVAGDEDADSTRAPPTVTISTGALSGKWLTTRDGRDIAAFLGIPYAAPPVGPLRFKEPQPAQPWSGVRQAASPSDVCIQRNVYFHQEEIVGSEDCLYINVHVPEGVSHAEPLPVLFFIHGGGWLSGAGFLYGPEYLLDKDVVLVTFNYRLGPLGFLSTGDAAVPGNNGLKDMVHALRWVQDNIRPFGGDPNSVTVAGQSAGAASSHLMTLSPLAKGLFHRAFLMSGNAFTTWAFHSPLDARRQARVLAKHTQCPDAPSDALLQCLRAKEAEDIVSVDERFMRWDIHPHMPFKATVEVGGGEGAFMDVHPRQAYGLDDRLNDVPVLTGLTAQDGGVLVAVLLDNDTALMDLNENFDFIMNSIINFDSYPVPMREETLERVRRFYFGEGPIDRSAAFNLIDMATDLAFLYPTMQLIKMQKKYGKAPVYFYEFAHMSQSHRSFVVLFGAQSPDFGVCHSDDLLYLFPLDAIPFPEQPGTDDVFVSRKFVDYVVHFMRTGKPTADRSWQEVAHPDAAEYMHIGSPGDIQMRANLAPDRMRLWSEVPIQIGRMSVPHDEL